MTIKMFGKITLYEIGLLFIIIGIIAYSLPGITEDIWPCGNEGVASTGWAETAAKYVEKCHRNTVDAFCVERPPGIAFLILLSYIILGVGAFATKMTTLFVSIASIILLYLFAKTYWNKKVALFSCFFTAFSPMFFFMRNFLSSEILAPLFISAILYTYAKWLATSERKYFLSIFLVSGLGMFLGDWAVYFIIPPIIIHYFIFVKKHEKNNKFLLLIPLSITMFLMYIGYIYLLTGSGGIERLIDTFFIRTNLKQDEHPYLHDLTFSKFISSFIFALSYYYTILLYVPILFFALFLLKLKSGNSEKHALAFLAFISLTLFLFVFKNLFLWHNTAILILVSTMGLLTGILINDLWYMTVKKNNIKFYLFVAVCMITFVLVSYHRYVQIYSCI